MFALRGARLAVTAAVAGVVLLIVAALALILLLVGALAGEVAHDEAANPPDFCVPVIGLPGDPGAVRNPTTGGFTVTSEYGMRLQPVTGEWRLHAGIDMAQDNGGYRPIVAAAAGQVVETGNRGGPGLFINIDHGGGFVTRYLHLSRIDVQVGHTVAAGDPIGVEGNTGGISTGAHLHFETLFNGKPEDPREWFAENGIAVPEPGKPGAAPPPGEGGQEPVPTAAPASYQRTQEGDIPSASSSPADVPEVIEGYRGEQLVNAGHIIVKGQEMDLDQYTIALGVMTAMGESSLINVDHGDEVGPDSRGLFQQRSSWGTEEERMHPPTAAGFFFDALVQVEDYRDLPPTIAAHRTQRNADPNHYEPFWEPAVIVTAVLTEDEDFLDELLPIGCGDPITPPPPGDGSGEAIVEAATAYAGTPYSWGGGDVNGPTLGTYGGPGWDGRHIVGFDCSGLVLYAVYQATGVELPHSAEMQGQRGAPVPRDYDQMVPGDVISFSEDGSGNPGSFGHVGIYIGDGKMIHAPLPDDVVKETQLQGNRYWEDMHWEVRRYSTQEPSQASGPVTDRDAPYHDEWGEVSLSR